MNEIGQLYRVLAQDLTQTVNDMSSQSRTPQRPASATAKKRPTKSTSFGTRFFTCVEKRIEDMAHNALRNDMTLLKRNNANAVKGRLWEILSLAFLKACYPSCQDVWLLKHMPQEIQEEAGLRSSRDIGIDLVMKLLDGALVAIQCKYRGKRRAVPWKDLATFEALCNRTGPWKKWIVTTNSRNVLTPPSANGRQAHSKEAQTSQVIGSTRFCSLDYTQWLQVLGALSDEATRKVDMGEEGGASAKEDVDNLESMRQKRLAFFSSRPAPATCQREKDLDCCTADEASAWWDAVPEHEKKDVPVSNLNHHLNGEKDDSWTL